MTFPATVVGTAGITYSAGVFTNSNSFSVFIMGSYIATFAQAVGGQRITFIIIDSGTQRYASFAENPNAVAPTQYSGAFLFPLPAGSNFRLQAFQNQTSALALNMNGAGANPTNIAFLAL